MPHYLPHYLPARHYRATCLRTPVHATALPPPAALLRPLLYMAHDFAAIHYRYLADTAARHALYTTACLTAL